MTHQPIQLKNINLSFPHKVCFEDFSANIHYGCRIGIMGCNGSGKSTLLKILKSIYHPTSGTIDTPKNFICGYVPQIIEAFDKLSGGQRFNKALTKALSIHPNVLLLDEPTNHLDSRHRKSLMRMLHSYPGTLIIVTHDKEILRTCVATLWHIDQGKIHVFCGNYDDYMEEIAIKIKSIEGVLSVLNRQKKDIHQSLMKEQQRASKSKQKGEKNIDQRKWPTVVSKAKTARANNTSGDKKAILAHKKLDLNERLATLRAPETITPTFSLKAADIEDRTLVSILDGAVGYSKNHPILKNINLSLGSKDRLGLIGDNGSGKSTLLKTIFDEPSILKDGVWNVPKPYEIGYLDQHYETLTPHKSALELMRELEPTWTHAQIRKHLNDFLFRKNEEVNAPVSVLSGGEKSRLCLALIAARTPNMLILDEITNNLDLETRTHVASILKAFPGAMIVVSHDQDFLAEIGVNTFYDIKKGSLKL